MSRQNKLSTLHFLIILCSIIFVGCGDEDEKLNLEGTWIVTHYDSIIEVDEESDKPKIESAIKYSLPFAGDAIYVFDKEGEIIAYPCGQKETGYKGTYSYNDGKLNLQFTYGGGLTYKDLDIDINENTLKVNEDMTSIYSNNTSASRVIRIHNLVRR